MLLSPTLPTCEQLSSVLSCGLHAEMEYRLPDAMHPSAEMKRISFACPSGVIAAAAAATGPGGGDGTEGKETIGE